MPDRVCDLRCVFNRAGKSYIYAIHRFAYRRFDRFCAVNEHIFENVFGLIDLERPQIAPAMAVNGVKIAKISGCFDDKFLRHTANFKAETITLQILTNFQTNPLKLPSYI
jgi:hypothetical protein